MVVICIDQLVQMPCWSSSSLLLIQYQRCTALGIHKYHISTFWVHSGVCCRQLRWSQRKLASLQFFNGVTFPSPLDAQLAYSPVKTYTPHLLPGDTGSIVPLILWILYRHYRKRLCPSIHVGNAQYDSKLFWLDSRCLTYCPTLNHFARLHFSCVYSLVFPKVNNFSFGILDIHHWMNPSVYDRSYRNWLIINWWTTHRHQRIDYTLYHSCTPIVLLAHHMAYNRQVKDGSLLNNRCPVCCSYYPMSQTTFLIEDGNVRLYLEWYIYSHCVWKSYNSSPRIQVPLYPLS